MTGRRGGHRCAGVRPHKQFHFFDKDSLRRFMMDILWRTLTNNLNAKNIYYTMDSGKELAFDELYPVNVLPSDIPYMGSDFYFAYADVRGDEESPYARTKGLLRLDGATDTAIIEMDGLGGFTMYYADRSVEAVRYLECTDENGNSRFDMYSEEGKLIVSFCFDSDKQFHIVNNDSVYLSDAKASYRGIREYPLEIYGEEWNLCVDDGTTLLAEGRTEYAEDAACLMNADGSSGGGRVFFDENNLVDTGKVLICLGGFEDVPSGE